MKPFNLEEALAGAKIITGNGIDLSQFEEGHGL